ncbi:MAG: hypothetical protein EAZ89_14555, partial [Bacteroidetes bacterium]
MKIFYRRYEVVNRLTRENVPVIYASNHQNALMDALNASVWTSPKRQPLFMTRADVFNSRFDKFLRGVKMLPIYRTRDGLDSVRMNTEIFERVVEELSHSNGCMIIFPEGNHNRRYQLRPLQKGLARMAFQTAEKWAFKEPVWVIPVGQYYKNHLKVRSDFLLEYGEPIDISAYYELYQESPPKAYLRLNQDLAAAMKDVMIHISLDDTYELTEQVRQIATRHTVARMGLNKNALDSELQAGKKLVQTVEDHITAKDPLLPELAELVPKYSQELKNLRLRDHVVENYPYNLLGLIVQKLLLLAGLPVHLYAVVNHVIPHEIARRVTESKFADDHFHTSVKFVMAMVLFPLFYLLQTLIVSLFTDGWATLIYFISLPVSG